MESIDEHNNESASDKPAQLQTSHPVEFKFHGKTTEFFRIWIVNVLLSIITLGIYSAWAKVRTNRYMYGNIELDNHRFSYLAKPLQILKGRIIAVLLFAVYYFLSIASPVAGLMVMAAVVVATPWLICSSLRFNMRMSSYRNVRFDFKGKYGQALLNFIVLPIASIFTLYLLLPYVFKRMDNFIVSNTRYGDRAFSTELSAEIYYVASFIAGLFGAVMIAVMVVVANFTVGSDAQMMFGDSAISILPIVTMALYLVVFTVIQAFYKAQVRNHVFQSTFLQGVAHFDSNYTFSSLAALMLTNLLALVLSFGLAYPWVKIRMANYQVNRTQVIMVEDREQVIDVIGENTSAITDEVANVFDVDVALT